MIAYAKLLIGLLSDHSAEAGMIRQPQLVEHHSPGM